MDKTTYLENTREELEVIKLLVESKADLTTKNIVLHLKQKKNKKCLGKNALHYLAKRGAVLSKYLLELLDENGNNIHLNQKINKSNKKKKKKKVL